MSQTIIKGEVTRNKLSVADAEVFLYAEDTVCVQTNLKGRFEFPPIKLNTDTFQIAVYKDGFIPVQHKFSALGREKINIELGEQIYNLSEVTVTAAKNVVASSNKITYKVDPDRFLKTEKGNALCNTLPGMSTVNGTLLLDNRKNVKIYIDGIESNQTELDNLSVSDIDKVEVIRNPSSAYGSEFNGAVLNVYRKHRAENLYKGELPISKGNRLNGFTTTPSFIYKRNGLLVSALYNYAINNQITSSYTDRVAFGEPSAQTAITNTTGHQYLFLLKMSLAISKDLQFVGNFERSGYKFDSDVNIDNRAQSYGYQTFEGLRRIYYNGALVYTLKHDQNLALRGRYFTYHNSDDYEQSNFTHSVIKESSSELQYSNRKKHLGNVLIDFSGKYKYVYRQNLLNELSSTQSIHSFYTDWNFTFSSSLSGYASLCDEVTNLGGDAKGKSYNNFLPNLSFMYKLTRLSNVNIDYSRKIERPNANYMNPNTIFLTPFNQLKGNPLLRPQLADNFELSYTKMSPKGRSFGIHLFSSFYKREIAPSYNMDNETIITEYQNSGKSYTSGGNLNIFTPIGKHLSMNLTSGISYASYKADASALVRENSGYYLNENLYLYWMYKSWSASVNVYYATRSYSLTSTTKYQPLVYMSINKNILKNKASIGLVFSDLFNSYSRTRTFIQSSSFTQHSSINREMTLVRLKFTYRFGKSFNSRISNQDINNNDIKVK
jgi:hypothetical protein